MGVDTEVNRFGGKKLRGFSFEAFYLLCEVRGNIYQWEEMVEKLKVPTQLLQLSGLEI